MVKHVALHLLDVPILTNVKQKSSKKISLDYLFFEVEFMLVSVAVKKAILNLRLRPEVRDEFAVAADLRGASMSSLLHQFIVRTIREEKELSPQSFIKSEPTVNDKIIRAGGLPVAPRSKSGGIPLMNSKTTERRKVDAPQHKKKSNKRVA